MNDSVTQSNSELGTDIMTPVSVCVSFHLCGDGKPVVRTSEVIFLLVKPCN
jgi:hypothetical protein